MSLSQNLNNNDKLEPEVCTTTSDKTDSETSANDLEASSLKPDVEEGLTTGTDEDDGLKKIASKILPFRLVEKKSKDKNNIEPYIKNPLSWTYSKYGVESGVIDEETRSTTDRPTGSVREKLSQRQIDPGIANKIDSDIYNFTHPKRGYLLLVINEKFYRQAERQGAQVDLLKMKTVANKLGLRLLNDTLQMNLSKSETMEWLQMAQTTDHTDCDCFVFMISTHGLEQKNPKKGGKVDHALVCADDMLIFTSDIVEMFNETNCPTLKGKPKIFIIQACRGNDVDHGSDVNVTSNKNKAGRCHRDKTAKSDNVTQPDVDLTDTKAGQDSWADDSLSDTEAPCLQCDVDMLVMYAVPPGMLAWRNTSDGSWMVHYLHEVLLAYDMEVPKNFLHVLTKVSAKMSLRTTDTPAFPDMHEKKAVPVIEHKLTKDILFS